MVTTWTASIQLKVTTWTADLQLMVPNYYIRWAQGDISHLKYLTENGSFSVYIRVLDTILCQNVALWVGGFSEKMCGHKCHKHRSQLFHSRPSEARMRELIHKILNKLQIDMFCPILFTLNVKVLYSRINNMNIVTNVFRTLAPPSI